MYPPLVHGLAVEQAFFNGCGDGGVRELVCVTLGAVDGDEIDGVVGNPVGNFVGEFATRG